MEFPPELEAVEITGARFDYIGVNGIQRFRFTTMGEINKNR